MTDEEYGVPLVMQGPYGSHLHPALERTILNETPDYIVLRDAEGNVITIFKDDPLQSMPQWIKYPMKARQEWEHVIKPRLDARVPSRRPIGDEWDCCSLSSV